MRRTYLAPSVVLTILLGCSERPSAPVGESCQLLTKDGALTFVGDEGALVPAKTGVLIAVTDEWVVLDNGNGGQTWFARDQVRGFHVLPGHGQTN